MAVRQRVVTTTASTPRVRFSRNSTASVSAARSLVILASTASVRTFSAAALACSQATPCCLVWAAHT